jgi:flagellar assembly protein FliH
MPLPPRPASSAEVLARTQALAVQEQRLREEGEALKRILTSLQNAAQAVATQQMEQLAEVRRVTVELAVAIASRLIHERILAGQFGVETLVRQVLEKLEPRQPIAVRLHPDDLALLKRRLPAGDPLANLENDKVRFVADPALSRGDCRAEAGDVRIVSHLQGQLEEIRQHLLRSVGHAQSGPQSA